MTWRLLEGDVETMLEGELEESVDAVLCDPPYGLAARKGARRGFMGCAWDYDVPSVALWRAILRVCKPGAPLIAFSSTRTYHRMVVNLEDAGADIRDQLAWNFGSGFPKSLNTSLAVEPRKPGTPPKTEIGKRWLGWGGALKPAFEPAVLARKPLDGTVAENVKRWGVGALGIDATRIGSEGATKRSGQAGYPKNADGTEDRSGSWARTGHVVEAVDGRGRWPANVLLDEVAAATLDAQTGSLGRSTGGKTGKLGYHGPDGSNAGTTAGGFGDAGGASRFFYVAKASSEERELGCDGLRSVEAVARFADGTARRCAEHGAAVQSGANVYTCGCAIAYGKTGAEACGRVEGSAGLNSPRAGANRKAKRRVGNHHPTVKPIELCRYLARMIRPPVPGRILVPFAGSGSEMIGCVLEGWPDVVGIEREADFATIARARLALVASNPRAFEPFAENGATRVDPRQIELFGRTGT